MRRWHLLPWLPLRRCPSLPWRLIGILVRRAMHPPVLRRVVHPSQLLLVRPLLRSALLLLVVLLVVLLLLVLLLVVLQVPQVLLVVVVLVGRPQLLLRCPISSSPTGVLFGAHKR